MRRWEKVTVLLGIGTPSLIPYPQAARLYLVWSVGSAMLIVWQIWLQYSWFMKQDLVLLFFHVVATLPIMAVMLASFMLMARDRMIRALLCGRMGVAVRHLAIGGGPLLFVSLLLLNVGFWSLIHDPSSLGFSSVMLDVLSSLPFFLFGPLLYTSCAGWVVIQVMRITSGQVRCTGSDK